MQPTNFLLQATLDTTIDTNTSYTISTGINDGAYPTAFSTGYLPANKVPRFMKPSYSKSTYKPSVTGDFTSYTYSDIQNGIYDVFYMGNQGTVSYGLSGIRTMSYQRNRHGSNDEVRGIYALGINQFYKLYGKFSPRAAIKPSYVSIYVGFIGYNGSTYVNGYHTHAGSAAFDVKSFKETFIDKTTTKNFTYGGETFDWTDPDFMEKGYKFVDTGDSGITGFMYLKFEFWGYGRNTWSSGSTGNYSYVFPALGAQLDYLSDEFNYTEALSYYGDWSIFGCWGSIPYGISNRFSWGDGIRYYPQASPLYGFDCDTTETSWMTYYNLNGGVASKAIRGYTGGTIGRFGNAPEITGSSAIATSYSRQNIRYMAESFTEDQNAIVIPEGRTDFGCLVGFASIMEIYALMCLQPCWAMPNYENNYGKLDANFYYPVIVANEYKCELIPGDDPDILTKVPSWILQDDSTLNEYNPEEDRPTPTPEDAGEDDTRQRNENTNLPSFSGIRLVSGTGFSTFYNLSAYHVAGLSTYLSQMPQTFWETLGTATDYKMANILDFICGLKWYPLNVQASAPSLYPDTMTSSIQFGFNGTSAVPLTDPGTSYKLGTVNRIFDFGTIYVPYRSNDASFLDYEPYTDVYANLPFIGKVQLHANQVMGYQISCHYVVDLITGMCTCFLDNGFDTIFTGSGKIGVDITVFGNDIITQSERLTAGYTSTATHGIDSALSIGSAVAAADGVAAATGFTSAISGIVADCIQTANAKRGIPQSVGGGSGFGSTYCDSYPVIIVNRPAVKIPAGYGHQTGYVSNTKSTISSLSGFTICSNPDLSGIAATSAELDMIRDILSSGFYA